jgi:site-specific recombinase XerD
MLQRGADPVYLQMILGHSTLGTLSQYLRLTITDLKEAHSRTKPGK